MEVVLVRAGATSWQERDRLQGNLDIPLSEDGLLSAKAVSTTIKNTPIRRFYSGFSLPAYQTARILAESHGRRTVVRKASFNEMDLGIWQGLLALDIKRKHRRTYLRWLQAPETVRPPMGEDLTTAYRRLVTGLEEVIKANNRSKILVVTSPFAHTLMLCYLRDRSLGEFWRIFREAKKCENFAF